MFKRLLLIGGLVISAVALSGTHANAQFFDGWGWFGFSGIHGDIDTAKTPNPQGQPSQITVTVDATIQIACINPANNGVFNGIAFHRSLASSIPLGVGTVDAKGDATTRVELPLSGFEVKTNCPNKNWIPITDSAMALSFSGTALWCLLDKNGGPDCTRKGLLDSSPVTCSLDMSQSFNQRTPDGTAPEDAVFTCSTPQ